MTYLYRLDTERREYYACVMFKCLECGRKVEDVEEHDR